MSSSSTVGENFIQRSVNSTYFFTLKEHFLSINLRVKVENMLKDSLHVSKRCQGFFKIFPDFIKLFVQIPSHKYKNWPDLKVDI